MFKGMDVGKNGILLFYRETINIYEWTKIWGKKKRERRVHYPIGTSHVLID